MRRNWLNAAISNAWAFPRKREKSGNSNLAPGMIQLVSWKAP